MKKEDLRKVEYSKENPSQYGFDPDKVDDPKENEKYEKRLGFFHTWSKSTRWNAQLTEHIEVQVAIVEDAETGEVHEIDPECIKFIKEE